MRNPATSLASLAIVGALLVGGCTADTGTGTAAGAGTAAGTEGTTTAVAASSVTGAVSELTYTDLGVPEAELVLDTADAVAVTLSDGASSGGKGVNVLGDTVTLSAGGTYAATGPLTSGSLVIDAPDAVVNLVLDGVDITAADVAAINVFDAGQVVVWLADGSANTLADAPGAVVADSTGVPVAT